MRLVMFGAMAALLLVSLCVPEAFGNLALAFALFYGVVRVAHIGLFMLASPEDDALRHSVLGLAVSTADRRRPARSSPRSSTALAQGALWALALFLDMGGPYFFGSEGWKLVPGHFAERHGLIVIIALGESIVAIGVGASGALTSASAPPRCSASAWPRRCGGSTSTSSRSSPARRLAEAEAGPGAERDGARLLLLPAPADGRRDRPRRARDEERRSATSTTTCTRSPPSPCSAASPSTCSASSPSATATSTRSTASAWRSRSSC